METIGGRILRLRNAKGWSRPELGREMARAIGRKKPFSGELIRLYEENINRPGGDARRALAKVFDRDEPYIEFGTMPGASRAAGPEAAKVAREPEAGYQVSDEALAIARGWEQLSAPCQEHVRRQIELLRGAGANHHSRRKAARHDVEIKGGALRSGTSSKIKKRDVR